MYTDMYEQVRAVLNTTPKDDTKSNNKMHVSNNAPNLY